MAKTYGVGIIPWSPLASGMLTGKYKPGAKPAKGTRFDDEYDNPILQRRMNDDVLRLVEKLRPMAEAKGCTMSQFSLAWCMSQDGITSPIIGPRSMEQYDDNIRALNVNLMKEDFEAVDALVKPGTFAAPYYEADFGPHKYRW